MELFEDLSLLAEPEGLKWEKFDDDLKEKRKTIVLNQSSNVKPENSAYFKIQNN